MKPTPDAPPPSRTRLRLERARISFRDREGLLSILEVEVPGSCHVRRPIYRALWSLRAQVVRADEVRDGDRTVHRFRVVEFDGAPLLPARRVQIQAEIAGLTGELLGEEEPLEVTDDRALARR